MLLRIGIAAFVLCLLVVPLLIVRIIYKLLTDVRFTATIDPLDRIDRTIIIASGALFVIGVLSIVSFFILYY